MFFYDNLEFKCKSIVFYAIIELVFSGLILLLCCNSWYILEQSRIESYVKFIIFFKRKFSRKYCLNFGWDRVKVSRKCIQYTWLVFLNFNHIMHEQYFIFLSHITIIQSLTNHDFFAINLRFYWSELRDTKIYNEILINLLRQYLKPPTVNKLDCYMESSRL